METNCSAGIFEHVAKMGRITAPPTQISSKSVLPVRIRPSMNPLAELSSLPMMQRTVIGEERTPGKSTESVEDDTKETAPIKNPISRRDSTSTIDSIQEQTKQERDRNKQRIREKMDLEQQEKENTKDEEEQDKTKSEDAQVTSSQSSPEEKRKSPKKNKHRHRKKKEEESETASEMEQSFTGRNMRARPRSKSRTSEADQEHIVREQELLNNLTQHQIQAMKREQCKQAAKQLINEAYLKQEHEIKQKKQHPSSSPSRGRSSTKGYSAPPSDQRSETASPDTSYTHATDTEPSRKSKRDKRKNRKNKRSALERLLQDGTTTGLPLYSGSVNTLPRTDLTTHTPTMRVWDNDANALPTGAAVYLPPGVISSRVQGQGDVPALRPEDKALLVRAIQEELRDLAPK